MAAQTEERNRSHMLTILFIGAVLALLLGLLVNLQAAIVVALVTLPVAAYGYARWERAWAAGLVSALGLAFMIGGWLRSPADMNMEFALGGAWALLPVLLSMVMMFAAATQLLIVWRCGDRTHAWRLMLGFFISGIGRLQGLLLGLAQQFFSIQIIGKGGTMIYARPPSKSIRMLGPGMIIVDSGNALVLENTGKITRIVGPGFVRTEPYEVISAIVDLTLQQRRLESSAEMLTRDGIPLQVTCTILFRILGDEAALLEKAEYRIDERAIRRAVLRAADWKEQTELVARAVLRDSIAGRVLDQIVYNPRQGDGTGPLAPRTQFQEAVRQEIDRQSRAWGVEMVRVTLDEIRIPDRVKERLLDYWDREWRYNVELFKAVSDVEVMLMKARGEGEAAQIQAIANALARLEAAKIQAQTTWVEASAGGVAQFEATRIRRQTSEIEAEIKGVEARAQAEAHILKQRGEAIAQAERFQRVLGAIQEIAGRDKMVELTQELIRVLTSVNDVQAVVRILGWGRSPMLPAGDGQTATGEAAGQGGGVIT